MPKPFIQQSLTMARASPSSPEPPSNCTLLSLPYEILLKIIRELRLHTVPWTIGPTFHPYPPVFLTCKALLPLAQQVFFTEITWSVMVDYVLVGKARDAPYTNFDTCIEEFVANSVPGHVKSVELWFQMSINKDNFIKHPFGGRTVQRSQDAKQSIRDLTLGRAQVCHALEKLQHLQWVELNLDVGVFVFEELERLSVAELSEEVRREVFAVLRELKALKDRGVKFANGYGFWKSENINTPHRGLFRKCFEEAVGEGVKLKRSSRGGAVFYPPDN